MPVYRIVRGNVVKWRWGKSGREYDTKQEAEAQGRAAYASGYRGNQSNKSKQNKSGY